MVSLTYAELAQESLIPDQRPNVAISYQPTAPSRGVVALARLAMRLKKSR